MYTLNRYLLSFFFLSQLYPLLRQMEPMTRVSTDQSLHKLIIYMSCVFTCPAQANYWLLRVQSWIRHGLDLKQLSGWWIGREGEVSTNQCISNENTARWVLEVSPGRSSAEECLRVEELKSIHHLLLYMMYYIIFFELREAGGKRS